jgi:hypothetical protein
MVGEELILAAPTTGTGLAATGMGTAVGGATGTGTGTGMAVGAAEEGEGTSGVVVGRVGFSCDSSCFVLTIT